MNSKQIKTHLETWAIERFEDAESIKVVRNEFGDWNVEVDWDGGYFVEIHSYVCQNGKFRSLGVTEVTY